MATFLSKIFEPGDTDWRPSETTGRAETLVDNGLDQADRTTDNLNERGDRAGENANQRIDEASDAATAAADNSTDRGNETADESGSEAGAQSGDATAMAGEQADSAWSESRENGQDIGQHSMEAGDRADVDAEIALAFENEMEVSWEDQDGTTHTWNQSNDVAVNADFDATLDAAFSSASEGYDAF